MWIKENLDLNDQLYLMQLLLHKNNAFYEMKLSCIQYYLLFTYKPHFRFNLIVFHLQVYIMLLIQNQLNSFLEFTLTIIFPTFGERVGESYYI